MGARAKKSTKPRRNQNQMARNNRANTNKQASGIATRVPTKSLNWNARYGKNYKKQCAIAHQQHKKGKSLCCCCLKQLAKYLHHTSYGGNRLGDNWFPVCKRCHDDLCHSPDNWMKDNKNPVWGNRNTEGFTKRLRLGYQLLSG